MPTVSPLSRIVSLFAALFLLVFAALPPKALAQDGAATLAKQGQEALNLGDYQAAVTAFQSVVDDYKMSLIVPEAYAKLGYAQFLLEDLDKAETNLRAALAAPNISESVKEFAMNALPQAIAAKAAKTEAPDEKKKLYAAAIKEYDAVLAAYPRGAEAEATLYGKALAQYFSELYSEAAGTLTDALSRFGNTASVADTKYLLAVSLTAQASKALLDNQEANLSQALQLYEAAHKHLQDIIKMQGAQRNAALINDSHFQEGEIYFNEGILATDPAKQQEYMAKSLAAYREVLPLSVMIKAQEARINEIVERINSPEVRSNVALYQAESRRRDRERIKLNQLRAKPPQTLDAKIKAARIFSQLGKYDEARVILKFLGAGGFEMTEDQQKQILYYLTLSYGQQDRMDLALANYEAFQERFKGDAMAENLPLVIGNLFLKVQPPEPQKALEFFEKGLEMYPKGNLVAASQMAKGQALLSLQRFDEAVAAFDASLAANPDPDVSANAQLGKGVTFMVQGKWDDAIGVYRGIVEKFGGKDVAKEARMRMAYAMQQKGDLNSAASVVNELIAADPASPMAVTGLSILAEIHNAQGKTDEAVATYQKIFNEHPDSPEAPAAMLQIAVVHAQKGESDKQEALLRQYLEKFPEDENVLYAYNQLVQLKVGAGAQAEAAALWAEFAAKYAKHPNAALALLNQAQLLKGVAQARGGYVSLDPASQGMWVDEMRGAAAAAEKLVREYPESDVVSQALALILEVRRALVGAQVEDAGSISTYFEGLASELSATPAARSRTLFVLASYVQPQDPARALTLMQEAYDPALIYNAEDLDIYGLALMEQGQVDEAAAIFQKILNDYPLPEGVELTQVPLATQKAQSIGLYGLAKVAEKKGDAGSAGKLFEELKTKYPWSPKIREADYGIAQSLLAAKKFDDAMNLVIQIPKDRNATPQLKAKSVLLAGHIEKERGDADTALANFKKIYLMYPVADEAAAEGLWQAAQIYKTKGLTEEHDKAIEILKTKYPNTKWATEGES